jgi:hypothetical protein
MGTPTTATRIRLVIAEVPAALEEEKEVDLALLIA